ncbi:MAG: 3-dehydroquinate synthase, partial [Sulfuritalea sp.]|nr:3-dehydroquinate synthase [Sulfuritalea sp.]
MRRLDVELAARSYPILIGGGLLSSAEYILPLLRTRRIALVTNVTIAPLYLEQVRTALEKEGVEITPVVLPDGEAHKTWESLNLIYDALLSTRC